AGSVLQHPRSGCAGPRSRGRGRDAPAARPLRPCGSYDGPGPAGDRVAAAAPLPGARSSARVPGLRASCSCHVLRKCV
ncbi:MAG: hypothetical protein AVDCRST_MAG60-359, partial [uncultured Nocardioides sp.]